MLWVALINPSLTAGNGKGSLIYDVISMTILAGELSHPKIQSKHDGMKNVLEKLNILATCSVKATMPVSGFGPAWSSGSSSSSSACSQMGKDFRFSQFSSQ